MSKAQRKAHSERMKKYWAARKAAKPEAPLPRFFDNTTSAFIVATKEYIQALRDLVDGLENDLLGGHKS